jgi:hypothetical protein
MNPDKLRQQITVVTDDLPALDAEAASGDDFARHLVALLRVAADNAAGCVMLAEASLSPPLATVTRSILEGLFVTYWALLSDENARTVVVSFRNEGARLLRNLLQKRRGIVISKTTGENFTDELRASPLFVDAKRPLVVFKLAEEAGLEKLYDIFYTFLSMFAHGTATEILAGVGAGAKVQHEKMIPVLVEAARSFLKYIHVIVVNKVRFGRRTARDELESILKIPL